MDPNTCYQMILEYIETHDYTEARIYAVILHNWLAQVDCATLGEMV